MEQNKFELLDEIDTDIQVNPSEAPKLKEYEKLLLAERNRKDYVKAVNLVKYGCFEQKQETTISFEDLELIPSKKYKGLYQLYRNIETMQLIFVCPLVEDNKGDEDERKDLKPYAYDTIYIELMDNETYQMVSISARHNLSSGVSVAYKTSIILYFVNIVVTITYLLYNFILQLQGGNDFMTAVFGSIYYSVTLCVGVLISTPVLALLMMKYKKYRES